MPYTDTRIIVPTAIASPVPYDLSGFSIAHTVTWPTPPSTSSTFNVPADGTFATAVGTSGRLVNVSTGGVAADYLGASTWGDDIDVVMDNGVTITSNCDFGTASRVRWTGGNCTGRLAAPNVSDLLINNLNVTTSSNKDGIILNEGNNLCDRVALINSTFHGQGEGGSGWGIWSPPAADQTNGPWNTDLIIANCISRTNVYQGSRMMSWQRAVIVDSYIAGADNNNTSLRMHNNCQDVHIENVIGFGLTQFIPSGAQGSLPSIDNAVIRNYNAYHGSSLPNLLFNQTTAPNVGTVYDSTLHWVNGPASQPAFSPLSDGGGNTTIFWDGSTIDFSQGGALSKTTLAQYGADH